MTRLALVAALLLIPAAVPAQATVRGVALGTTIKVTDSVLAPATPVILTWDAAKGWWQGDGNGVTYRLVQEDVEWVVRAILPEGNFALAWSPASRVGILPIRFRDARGGGNGPMQKIWGKTGQLTITITP